MTVATDVKARLKALSPEKLRRLRQQLKAKQGKAGAPAQRSAVAPPPLAPAAASGPPPMSFQQLRLWFLAQLEPDSASYNNPGALRLTGELDIAALRASLDEVVRRHQTLRTTFAAPDGGEPVQIVAPARRQAVPLVCLAALPAARRQREAEARATLEARRPFELTAGPLLRCVLLRLTPTAHWLLFNIHHIVSDAWSTRNLVAELAALYPALARRTPCPLPPLAVQYGDFARWQRDWLQGEALDRQLTYWRERLAGSPPLLVLPTDRPRPPRMSYRGGSVGITLPRALGDALQHLGRSQRVTRFALLLAAFKALLYRYSGQVDLLVGAPIAYRNQPELEALIGFFANTLVLRSDLGGNPPFTELLSREQAGLAAAFTYQHLPFEKLVEVLQPTRSLRYTPIFQVAFSMVDLPPVQGSGAADAEPGAGLSFQPLSLDRGGSVFDLTLFVVDGEEGTAVSLEHSTDLFDRATVRRMLAHFQHLLTAIVAAPQTRLGALPLLGTAERHQLLRAWGESGPARERGTVIGLFATLAAAQPDAVAVALGSAQLSYGALAARAGRLAQQLRSQGMVPESRVGLLCERSCEQIIGLLGVLAAGAAFVPLDPSHPPSRLAFLLADAEVEVVLHDRTPGAGLPAGPWRTLHLDTASRGAAPFPAPPIAAAQAAYVIYTSGSTGQPKGVVVPHGSLVNHMHWMLETCTLGPGDSGLLQTALSFDAAVGDLFGSLLAGARLVLARPGGEQDMAYLVALIARQRIAALGMVSPLLSFLLAEPGFGACRSLRQVICGGEALTVELMERFLDGWPAAPAERALRNMYGPTEATIESTAWRCRPLAGRRAVPIGRPVSGVGIYVVDAALEPVPAGVSGELVIAGGLARGYLGRPGQTAACFVPDPLSGNSGQRLYRSGDRARWRPDGELVFLGRADHQVKVRGMRIELGEVEAAITALPAVREAAAVVREPAAGSPPQLVAYLVAAGTLPSHHALRDALRRSLPEPLVPAAFVELPALPLTATGKVDRAALPAPGTAAAEGGAGPVAPRTPVEEILANLWGELLNRPAIGVHDSFFSLGGHSLVATQLINRVARAFQVAVPLHTLFEGPTVASMAGVIERLQAGGEEAAAAADVPPIEADPANRHHPFPLTEVQEAYWIGRSGAVELGNVAAYGYVELQVEALEVTRLERALQRLIARHDMLRAIVRRDGRQQVLAEVPLYRIAVKDLRDADAEGAEAGLEAVRRAMSHQVLPSDRWPLFELRVSRLPGDEVVLHIGMDALVADASSFQILGRELVRLYADLDAPLPPLTLTFRDCVLAEVARRETPAFARALDYWRRRLPTLPPGPALPLAIDPASVETPRFLRHHAYLAAPSWRKLKQRAAAAALTPSSFLLAVFAEVLACWSASPRFTLNLTLFNRLPLHPEIDRVVGDFTSLTLLQVDFTAASSFEAHARRLQRQLWEDLDHRLVSGVRVLRELAQARGGQRGAGMPVVFTSVLDLADKPAADTVPAEAVPAEAVPAEDGEPAARAYGITQTPQVWLDHQVGEAGGVLSLTWDVVDGLFPAGLVEAMFAAYQGLLHRLAEDGGTWERPVRDLVPAAQLAQRAAINDTAAPLPRGLLHDGFLRQARAHPERPAVVAASVSGPARALTYGQLHLASAHLAATLRRRGVGPGQLVAVVMEKGWEQVLAVLAVLRAGAAYLPIDAALPAPRLAYLLAQGKVTVALTQPSFATALAWPPGVQPLMVAEGLFAPSEGEEAPPLAGVDAPQGPEALAYVIFTSGSTGQPKGVMIDHRGASNTIADINECFAVGPQDRVLGLSSLSFDLSVYDVFGPLAAGGALVLPAPDAGRDPAAWVALVAEHGVTIWNTVPALMEMLVAHAAGRPTLRLGSLRLVMMSGDWIPVNLPRRVEALTGRPMDPARAPDGVPVEIVSLGGATEASIWSILFPLANVDPAWTSIPYGRPMKSQTFAVLDHHLTPRPTWVPGALYIGGVGLAQGYWRDGATTAAGFVPYPESGERLYRTGDLGRYLPDGNIEFLGRQDFQVKVQGYRIELGEIEAALLTHPAVRAAVATVWGPPRGAKQLAAYVVMEGGAEAIVAAEEGMRDFLAARLPAHMVPARILVLDRLPLTPNGKVDRQALPRPEGEARSAAAAPTAPRTPLEAGLVAVWCEVLGRDEVGVDDNFFTLGGDSLAATRLVTQIERTFETALPLRAVFTGPTVAEMASAIEDQRATGPQTDNASTAGALPSLQPDLAGRHEPFPLTEVQEAYWVGRSDAAELGEVAAHIYFEVPAPGLDHDRLSQAWRRLIARHDMLRAVILPDGRQRILATVPPYEIAVVVCSGDDAAAQLHALRERMSHQVLPSDRWPLFEILVSRCATPRGGEQLRVHVSIDMLIGDAWSFQLLGRELLQLYHDPELALPTLELSFRDYVLAEVAWREGEAFRLALDYWRGRLATLPPAPQLPMVKDPVLVTRPRFTRYRGRLPAAAWKRLEARATAAALTPSGVVLAAFAEVLRSWSASPRFTLNLTLFNRLPLHPQVDALVGDFTSLTLLAAETPVDKAFAARARRLQHQLWDDLDQRLVSGVRVLRELARLRGGHRNARMPVVFTSTLSLTGRAGGDDAAAAAPQTAPPSPPAADDGADDGAASAYGITQTPQVWLDHQVGEERGALVYNWDVVAELFPDGLMAAMFAAYEGLLARLVDDDAAWTTDLPGLLPSAQLALRARVNDTAAPNPEGLLHAGFLRQAQAHPDRLAVIAAGTEGRRAVTYGALLAASARLAAALRRRGAAPGQLVAVVMEKGWEQVLAVLAILRAGAAYLPIDPALPAARVHHLLARGEATLALTQPHLAATLSWPADVVPLAVEAAHLRSEAASPPLPEPVQGPEALAYVIFTSGSTGEPKGVMIEHRSALNTVADINERFAVGPEDRLLGLSSLGFDLSVYDIFGPLAAGATLVLPPPGAERDPALWARLVAAEAITLWNTVPALMEMVVEYAAAAPTALHGTSPLRALRLVMLSGDWIPVTLPRRIEALSGRALQARGPGEAGRLQLISLGGATEAAIWSILFPITAVPPTWTSVPYGSAMINQTFAVLDHDLAPRPVWVPGDLYIGGAGVARGYWRDGRRTAASFIVDPAGGGRLYRTGDRGRYLPDGSIEFLGRDDFQVKVQGHRIELGEIEAALLAHPVVRAAVVEARGEAPGARQLVAYAVLDGAPGDASALLREHLAARLPAYMVPPRFVFLDALPLTANGKVDRRALPAPEGPASPASRSGATPASALEADLLTIWRQVLGRDDVGAEDNFFEVGGTSVLLVRAYNAIRERLGRELPLTELFHYPTIAALAHHLSADEPAAPTPRSRPASSGEDPQTARRRRRDRRRQHRADEAASSRREE